MPHLDSVDSGEMPWLSADTMNGLTIFFTILFFYCKIAKAKDGVEYEYDNMKCHKTRLF